MHFGPVPAAAVPAAVSAPVDALIAYADHQGRTQHGVAGRIGFQGIPTIGGQKEMPVCLGDFRNWLADNVT
jgi:hypothetical protein